MLLSSEQLAAYSGKSGTHAELIHALAKHTQLTECVIMSPTKDGGGAAPRSLAASSGVFLMRK